MNETADASEIRWPARFRPAVAPIHVRNELDVDAAPATLFAWLVAAPLWPDWYPNASHVRLLDAKATVLGPDVRFRWRTFGVSIVSQVREFVPDERVAWDGRAFGVDVYHAWLIRPTTHGAHVVTEETQYGFLTRAAAALRPMRMHRLHQIWLERLAELAVAGPPPSR